MNNSDDLATLEQSDSKIVYPKMLELLVEKVLYNFLTYQMDH